MSHRPALWIVNHYAATPRQGAGTRHYDLGRRLVSLGYDVTIFASAFSHFSGRDDHLDGWRLWRTENVDGIRFVWLRTVSYRGNSMRRVLNMLGFAGLLPFAQVGRHSPTVVLGSTVHPFAAWAASVIAASRRRPFIFEIRDLWPQTLIDMGAMRAGGTAARLLRALEAHLVRRAAAVITLLPGAEEYLRARNLPTGHLTYLPNGVEMTPSGIVATDGSVREVLSQIEIWRGEGRFVIGYVGSLGRANALHVVVDAVARLGGTVGLIVVGDGPERAQLIRSAPEAGCVRFFRPIPKSDVPTVLHALDAGVFHLADTAVFRYGISSNKLFDYLAAGKPVVFACSTSYDPVTRAGAGESARPEDPQDLARAIERLAARPASERAAMGERGRAYILEHHSMESLGTRLAAVIESVDKDGGA